MVRKKVDERIRILLENCGKTNTRSFLVVIGDNGKDQVPNLHYILSKSRVKARPTVLWCYNKELGFSSHKTKRLKQIRKLKQRGLYDPKQEGSFDLFISSTKIRYLYYKDSEKILGQTFGMLILQDFHCLTPNLLARTIETVEGGGLVVLLLTKMSTLRQFYSLHMDVHRVYKSNVFGKVKPRFNERFILSLTKCKTCLVIDDELNVLPVTKHMKNLSPIEAVDAVEENKPLEDLKKKHNSKKAIGGLIQIAKTLDQASALLKAIDLLVLKSSYVVSVSKDQFVSVTSGRGRGKSALLGLITAAGISLGLRNIFVTAPSPENLNTMFSFVIKGLEALKYQQHVDFEVIQGTENNILRVNILNKKLGNQFVQYIDPAHHSLLSSTDIDLLLVDEAAAIPLPVVKDLMFGNNQARIKRSEFSSKLVFLSSTITGYEGTGRSLSLKLLKELRERNKGKEVKKVDWRTNEFMFKKKELEKQEKAKAAGEKEEDATNGKDVGREKDDLNDVQLLDVGTTNLADVGLLEIELKEPIRYGKNDKVEKWLFDLLCLNNKSSTDTSNTLVPPEQCELFAVDRDTLFSFHKQTESFLSEIVDIYVSAHYKNSPDDLLLLADNPAHRLFVLLDTKSKSTPTILVVLQVSFEGNIEKKVVSEQLSLGNRKSGDLVPWLVSQQFQLYNTTFLGKTDSIEFGKLVGCRVVRIATNPNYFGLGYGKRAINRLISYVEGKAKTVSLSKLDENADQEQPFEGLVQGQSNGEDKIKPRKTLSPLFVDIAELKPVLCHYLSVSYGLTENLFRFWKSSGFLPIYLRQTKHSLTGEHSCVMIREAKSSETLSPDIEAQWSKG